MTLRNVVVLLVKPICLNFSAFLRFEPCYKKYDSSNFDEKWIALK